MWPTLLAVLHLICLPLGVAALLMRARSLANVQNRADLKPLYFWDNSYAILALVWIASGLYRAFGGTDKGSDYYLENHVFWLKMLLLAGLLAVETRPMIQFIRWRTTAAHDTFVLLEPQRKRLMKAHFIEFALLLGIVACAGSMARGLGAVSKDSLARGAAIYRSECAHCHQLDGRGQAGKVAVDFIADATRLAKSNRTLLESIDHGIPGTAMLGFEGRLSDEQQRQVLSYIRATFGSGRQP